MEKERGGTLGRTASFFEVIWSCHLSRRILYSGYFDARFVRTDFTWLISSWVAGEAGT